MQVRYKFVPQHKDGHYLDRLAQPTDDFMKAIRFNHLDDLEHWLTTRHCPDAPHRFRIVKIKVTYELEGECVEYLPEAN